MPGHDKKGKPGEKDPDPEPYLVVTMDMKREDMQRPFDPRKSYWCPDGKGGFSECLLVEKGDTEATVMIGHIVSKYSTHFVIVCVYSKNSCFKGENTQAGLLDNINPT